MPSTTADWPIQGRPHDSIWSIWGKALSDSVCRNPTHYVLATRPGTLTTSLGDWLYDSSAPKSPRWKVFIDQSSQYLFIPNTSRPDRCLQLSTPTRLAFHMASYDLHGSQHWLKTTDTPTDAVPAQPTTDGTTLRVNRPITPARRGPPPVVPLALSFPDYITTLPAWKTELLVGLVDLEAPDSLGTHLTQGSHMFLCSDGESKDHSGSFG
jgi:hypothetical protein